MIKIKHNKVPMTRKRRDAIRAAYFYAGELGIGKRDFTLEIDFKYDYRKTFQIYACVDYHSQKRITIEIDAGLSNEKMLTIIAHEMVHVKQYIKKELTESKSELQLWKGKKILEDTPYHRCPWELEAYKKQNVLYWEYVYFRDGET
jgi:hypothetical protein